MDEDKVKKSQVVRNDKGIRMKELAAATGLPKSAILHYVAQGLLPEPVRTGPNMAYYNPACIERIKFIKNMQETHSFPLGKIKKLLTHRDQGKDITPLVQLTGTIFGAADGPALTEAEFCEAAGLNSGQVRDLIENRLLLPLEKGCFNRQDVAICEIYGKCFAMGADISDLTFYADAAKLIVDREMLMRHKLTTHLPEAQDAERTERLVQGARAIRNYVIDRTFQQRVASAQCLKDTNILS